MPEALKDIFFGPAFFDDLSTGLRAAYPAFDARAYRQTVFDDQWPRRTLMARMRHGAAMLRPVLPADFREALALLRQVAPMLEQYGFEKLIFSEYVALCGLDDWDAALPALETFTQMVSAEFAVRPFILQDQPRMMAQMLRWAGHDSPAVRRLASEGCRPRLPWAMRLPALIADPAPIVPILDALKADPSEDVRRSVANNLNDIAKDNPAVTLRVLDGWRDQDTPEMAWLRNHALRTLLKAGNPEALAMLGYARNPAVQVHNLMVTPNPVPLGEKAMFSFSVESTGSAAQNLMIDFIVYYQKANGKQAPKVFKLAKKTLPPGETLHFEKKLDFKPISTRKYYPGDHAIEIQINGMRFGAHSFVVTS